MSEDGPARSHGCGSGWLPALPEPHPAHRECTARGVCSPGLDRGSSKRSFSFFSHRFRFAYPGNRNLEPAVLGCIQRPIAVFLGQHLREHPLARIDAQPGSLRVLPIDLPPFSRFHEIAGLNRTQCLDLEFPRRRRRRWPRAHARTAAEIPVWLEPDQERCRVRRSCRVAACQRTSAGGRGVN